MSLPKPGLSPRMRGNPSRMNPASGLARSIPAYAGEPYTAGNPVSSEKVYPRVCGGTAGLQATMGWIRGLSPRMRGNHLRLHQRRQRPGSIPAYAGEPIDCQLLPHNIPVYPRVCGGTISSARGLYTAAGLSPRMRGNLVGRPDNLCQARSIPAYAGEPAARGCLCRVFRVYPRVCGGTASRNADT